MRLGYLIELGFKVKRIFVGKAGMQSGSAEHAFYRHRAARLDRRQGLWVWTWLEKKEGDSRQGERKGKWNLGGSGLMDYWTVD